MSRTVHTADSKKTGPATRPAWDMPLRIVTGLFGAYLLTSCCTALLARLLPGPPAEASLGATMMSFAIGTAIVVWVFAARSALTVTAWVLGLSGLTGGLFWLSLPLGGPA